MPPAIENDSALEWLSFGGNNNAVILAPVADIRFPPMKFETREFQCVETVEQVLRPLVTETALLNAVVHEEVIKNWRAEHGVLFPELVNSSVSALCQQPCFLLAHFWRKRRDLARQCSHRWQIPTRHLERDCALCGVSGGGACPSHQNRRNNRETTPHANSRSAPACQAQFCVVDVICRRHVTQCLR